VNIYLLLIKKRCIEALAYTRLTHPMVAPHPINNALGIHFFLHHVGAESLPGMVL